MKRKYKFKSEASRQRHSRAMDDPLVRAIIGRKTAENWKNPEIRARRVAGLRQAWQHRPTRAKYFKLLKKMPRSKITGRFVSRADD